MTTAMDRRENRKPSPCEPVAVGSDRASRRRVYGFRSQAMKARGEPPRFSLYRCVVATPAGPHKLITGETVQVPYPLAMWEHVPGAAQFDTLAEALAEWPDAENGEA